MDTPTFVLCIQFFTGRSLQRQAADRRLRHFAPLKRCQLCFSFSHRQPPKCHFLHIRNTVLLHCKLTSREKKGGGLRVLMIAPITSLAQITNKVNKTNGCSCALTPASRPRVLQLSKSQMQQLIWKKVPGVALTQPALSGGGAQYQLLVDPILPHGQPAV